jgi:hypothetical protein
MLENNEKSTWILFLLLTFLSEEHLNNNGAGNFVKKII